MIIIMVIIIILHWSDSASRKLLLLVMGGIGKIFFLSFSFPPNTSPRVFLGGVVEEMRLGLSGG